MSRVRTAALLCACALAANIVAAPPKRTDNKGSENMAQERTIVIRRVLPKAFVYPFSLWPLPKYPFGDDPTAEYIYNGKTFKRVKEVERNKR